MHCKVLKAYDIDYRNDTKWCANIAIPRINPPRHYSSHNGIDAYSIHHDITHHTTVSMRIQSTTTLLITQDMDDSEYWMEQITQRMHDIDRKIVQILKQRHKNYDMVKEDTNIHELYHYNNTAASMSRKRSILLCVACDTKMERTRHTLCPRLNVMNAIS
eukprot:240537_1